MLNTLLSLLCFRQSRINPRAGSIDPYQCDEKKPICTNCANHAVKCDFSTPESPEREPAASSPFPVTSERHPSGKKYRFRISQYTIKASKQSRSTSVEPKEQTYRDAHTETNVDAISIASLELFHHFLVSTCGTIADTEEGCTIWQVHVAQWAIEFPSILHLTLSLSALHMAHEKPELREYYLQQADDHFTFGVQSVTAILSELNADTCQKVYMSAVMICFAYFGRGPRPGEYLVFSNSGSAEWLVLMHGVKLIVQSYSEKVFSGILEPKQASDVSSVSPFQSAEVQEHIAQVQGLHSLVDLQPVWDAADRIMYVSAIDDLTSTFEEVYEMRLCHRPAVGLMQILIGWIYRLPREFVAQLEQKDPLALVIFAHWAGLLKFMESVWFMKGWAQHVLDGVYTFLPTDMWEWVGVNAGIPFI